MAAPSLDERFRPVTPGFRIGVDLGGSKIEGAAVDASGVVRLRRRVPTPSGDYGGTISAIVSVVADLERHIGPHASVGIGMPGAISPATGRVKNANSTWLNGRRLQRDLDAALGRPVRLANDANCFALSEAADGAAAGCQIVFGVILGTGVGGGVVVAGRLLVGANAIAGEWGHNTLPAPLADELPGSACYCGRSGCIETFLSGPGMAADHRRHAARDLSAAAIASGAERGDGSCRATLDRYVDRLARSLATVINLIDPDAIVLGGGLSAIGALYDEVPQRWGRYIFSDRVDTRLLAPVHGDFERCSGGGLAVAGGATGMTTLCRDCSTLYPRPPPRGRCEQCASPRLVSHQMLAELPIAHVDCDAFYATVEKRERPELADRPVIVGGGSRGVVLACCYVARLYGVRSAMPMFKALAACPDAEVIRPNMAKYREVGRAVRAEMRALTPLVEPVSIDEAFLDLSGTVALHGAAPAQSLAALARRVEATLGITLSIGLSDSKFLAKIASDLDKPRGFAVLGRSDAPAFFIDKPVSLLWGVGTALQRRLAADGIILIGQLAVLGEHELAARYGRIGVHLARLARGVDDRAVLAHRPARSISAETTLSQDEAATAALAQILWPLCERLSAQLKEASLAAGAVTLKLKTSDFRLRTRSRRLTDPTQLAEIIFRVAAPLLAAEADGAVRFRLIGIGADTLVDARDADLPTLFDDVLGRPRRLERAVDAIRGRLGAAALRRGRGLALGAVPEDSGSRTGRRNRD